MGVLAREYFSKRKKCQLLRMPFSCAFAQFVLNQIVDIVTTRLYKLPQKSKGQKNAEIDQKVC
jgi:hypothetical protein